MSFRLSQTSAQLLEFFKLSELQVQKQPDEQRIDNLLEESGYVRKRLPEGPNSLMRAVSDALHFTTQYHVKIQQHLLIHLTNLITANKLPIRLNQFQGNTMLLKDYSNNPSLSGFEKINLELVSSLFKAKVVVYNITEDYYLNATIINNNFTKTIRLLRTNNNYFETIYPKSYMERMGACQNVLMNVISLVADGKPRHATTDKFVNYEYENWARSRSNSPSNDQNTRSGKARHKRSLSDGLPVIQDESQLKLYDLFVNSKPPEDFLKIIRQRKDTMESNYSINANFDFVDEPISDSPKKITQPAQAGYNPYNTNTNKAFFNDNMNQTEIDQLERTPQGKESLKSPVYFMNSPPPGLSPNRYPQKSYNFTEPNVQPSLFNPNNDLAGATSPTFQRSFNNLGSPSPMGGQNGVTYGFTASPTRLQRPYGGMEGEITQDGLSIRRAASGKGALLLQTAQPPNFMGGNSPAGNYLASPNMMNQMSAGMKEKKKPIILDEGMERHTGRLKFFDETKNYGFIVMDGDGSDIFVHYDDLLKANISKEALKAAKNGHLIRLAFSCMKYIGKYDKSRKATDIQVLEM